MKYICRFKEEFGDMWEIPSDAKCVTTNGYINKDGYAVMGRGTAKQSVDIFGLSITKKLARHLICSGNTPAILDRHSDGWYIISFPVKPRVIECSKSMQEILSGQKKHYKPGGIAMGWEARADLKIIQFSCYRLVEIADYNPSLKRILLPRPGGGNGERDWETEIKPILAKFLDERFVVVSF